MTAPASDFAADLSQIPWQAWLIVAIVALAGYLLARACEDYSQLDEPDYLDERADYVAAEQARRAQVAKRRTERNEARMRAAGDAPWWGGAA